MTHNKTCGSHPDSPHYYQRRCSCTAEVLAMGLEECHNKSCQTCAETFCGDCSRCLSERTGGSCSAEGSAMGVEKIIRDIQVGSYHAHCFNDVQLREILTKALISHGDAMYLAGALAHKEATKVEKEQHAQVSEYYSGYNAALTEVSAKSEEFLKGLREKSL